MTTLRRHFASSARHFSGVLGLVVVLGACEWRTDPTPSARPPDSAGIAAVAPAAPRGPAPALARVEVTSAGFQPSRIDVGRERSIVFRRTTDKTCATSVVFPGLGTERT